MANLLVSCCDGNPPGLFLVNTENGTVERLRYGYFSGIALAGSRIFVGEHKGELNGLLELDRSLTEVRRVDLPVNSPAAGQPVHSLFTKDGFLYVCTTSWNSITVLDVTSLEPVEEIPVPGTEPGRGDQNHLSSVWVDDHVLFMSVHNWSGSAPDRPGAILALDRGTSRIREDRSIPGLVQPHSVVRWGQDLFYCVSGDQALHHNGKQICRFRGYPRGLAVDAFNYYVGQSRFRYSPDIPAPCGVVIVGRRDGERRFIPLPAVEVFDVAILGEFVRNKRLRLLKESGFVLWLTGLSGAGKTTIANGLAADLRAGGLRVEVLDSDDLRQGLCRDLGYTLKDRERHAERVAFVAERLSRQGVIVIVSLISPYRSLRRRVREIIPRFVEVYVKCPLEVCAARDVKGLYRKAMQRKITHFTGISDPYEEPESPNITVETDREPPAASVRAILQWLSDHGYVGDGVDGMAAPDLISKGC